MTLNLTHLRQIAENASQGPWKIKPGNPRDIHDRSRIIDWDGHEVMDLNVYTFDGQHIATFDPPTMLALITRIEQAEHRTRRYKALAETRLETIQRVRDARANHPEIPACDRYTDDDDDTIKCGWKRALEDIDKALKGDQK